VTNTGRITLMVIIAALLAYIFKQWGNQVALKPKDPTHKIVCRCDCIPNEASGLGSERQTFEAPSGGCDSLVGVDCGHGGALDNCEKISVPASKGLSVSVDLPWEVVLG